jgi:hypothetical protein
MTERPHFRSENHQKKVKVVINFSPDGGSTAKERWQQQYDFTPETNMGRVALGCGTELFHDFPPIEDDLPELDEHSWPEPEFPED